MKVARRPTENEIVCAAFRKRLTEDFYAVDADGVILEGDDHLAALASTKAWRGEVWTAFRALEDRLCPVKAFEEGRT